MTLSSSRPIKTYKRKYKKTSSYAKQETSISDLPDELISKILSSLPTKDALRTCLMSKDWEYKWTSIYNVHIDDIINLSPKKTSFVNFVDRVLFLSHNVKSFRFSCRQKYDSKSMTAWISTVLSRNVESFEVTYCHAGAVLPHTLPNCTSLTILKLNLPCTFQIHTMSCFPNLIKLHLQGVEILNMFPDTPTIKLTFPKLRSCQLVECKWLNVNLVEIFAPALIDFTSKCSFDSDCKIKIEEARLMWFTSVRDLLGNFILTTTSTIDGASLLSTIVENDIPLFANNGLQARMFLRSLSSLKTLSLTGTMIKAIHQSKQGGVPLLFRKLEKLYINTCCYSEALFELLHAATSLKFLQVEVDKWDDYDYEAIGSVPSCITFHLKEIKFIGFVCKEPQLKLAKYLLKNATELKELHILGSRYCKYSTEQKNEIVEQLSNMPKLSVSLEIVVT